MECKTSTSSIAIKNSDISFDYKIEWHKKLGKGATEEPVYSCINISSGKKFAVKIVQDNKYSRREIQLQLCCQHSPNVLNIHDVYTNFSSRLDNSRREEHYLYIVMDLMEGGSLMQLLQQYSSLNCTDQAATSLIEEKEAVFYLKQIVNALTHLHRQGIIHRDLKPENILIKGKYSLYDLEDDYEQLQLQLADFGFSVLASDHPNQSMYTAFYVAPEVISQDKRYNPSQINPRPVHYYDTKCDLWSLGVIMFIMLSGSPPFYPETHTRNGMTQCMYNKIMRGEYAFSGEIWKTISSEARDLIDNLLQVDPAKRIPIEDILQHPWFLVHE